MNISKRAKSVDSSGIRKVFDLAQKLSNPINLSIGQPDFDVFEPLKNSAKKAIDDGKNQYTVTQGIEPLRAKIRHKFSITATNNSDNEVMITSGVSGGLLLSFMAVLDPSDEILIPDPFFCMYRDLAYLVNASPVFYDTYPDFALNPEKIEKCITKKTKAIILNSPANPTGHSFSAQELKDVIEIARRAGIWVIYDEIYDAFSYDFEHVTCYGSYENIIVLNGFSKSHGATGWRIGYAVGPKTVIQEMLKIQQYTFVCAPSIVQHAMIDALDCDLSDIKNTYKQKRDFVVNGLKDKFDIVKPNGAFYVFPKAPSGTGQQFVEECIKNNILVVPGNVFSQIDTHFRISYAAPMRVLERGVEALNKLV